MRYSSQLRIRVVILMAKFESAGTVRRTLQRENAPGIPAERTIRNIYEWTKLKRLKKIHCLTFF